MRRRRDTRAAGFSASVVAAFLARASRGARDYALTEHAFIPSTASFYRLVVAAVAVGIRAMQYGIIILATVAGGSAFVLAGYTFANAFDAFHIAIAQNVVVNNAVAVVVNAVALFALCFQRYAFYPSQFRAAFEPARRT
ncbi:MAG: hypothetical protein PHE65_08320, partial [Candidatus Omnitrophica bacterium]|nr:hypothetical protein [Candidatus Omnitrophota bacterium]